MQTKEPAYLLLARRLLLFLKHPQTLMLYLRLKRKAMLQGKTDAAELNAFFTEWRAYGFTRIHEWVSAETAHRAFLKGMWRGEELYKHWLEEGPEEQ